MKEILKKARIFFSNGNERSLLVKKNILQTFLVRVISIPISFILLPLTMNYVDRESYGVWITLSSMVAWMGFFDIGINNGLRNKLTESIAEGDYLLSRKYVSTTYAILSIISIVILGLFLIINLFIDWPYVLNTSPFLEKELSEVAIIVFVYFCVKFVLSTVNTILMSCQLAAQASLRGFIEQLSSLLVILYLTNYTTGSLKNLAMGLCVAPLVVLLFFNFNLFKGKFKHISPSLRFVDFTISRDLMGIGFKFFVIQIAGIVQFQTANFIIIHSFGPVEVTTYNIVFKYFSILTMLMAVLMTPIWSAVTDAFTKGDYSWIISTEKKFRKVALVLIGLGGFMLLSSQYLFNIWLGEGKIEVSFLLSFWMFLFTSISLFGSIYSAILNGVSALNIQFKASIVSPIVFMLSSYYLIDFLGMGIHAIVISSILANFNGFILAPLQYRNIFRIYESAEKK